MSFNRTTVFFASIIILCFFPLISHADKVYFSPDGKIAGSEKSPPRKKKPERAEVVTFLEKLEMEAEAAAIAGYQEGSIVKIEDGIVYRLFKHPVTECYSFKLYRRIKKTPVHLPMDSADDNNTPEKPEVQTASDTDGIKGEKAESSKSVSDRMNEKDNPSIDSGIRGIPDEANGTLTENNPKRITNQQDMEAVGVIVPTMTEDKSTPEKSPPDKKDDHEFPPVPEDEKEKKTYPPGKGKNMKKIFA